MKIIAKHIFIINGQGETGKDQFVKYVAEWNWEYHGNYYISTYSSVDRVKEAAELLGWDGTKNQKNREFLVKLKRLSIETYDGPYHYLCEVIRYSFEEQVLFLMVREPAEIDKLKNTYPQIKTILVTRGEPKSFGNGSDDGVFDYEYDIHIDNSGTLDDLNQRAKEFVQTYIQ